MSDFTNMNRIEEYNNWLKYQPQGTGVTYEEWLKLNTSNVEPQKCDECQFEEEHSQACSKYVEDDMEPEKKDVWVKPKETKKKVFKCMNCGKDFQRYASQRTGELKFCSSSCRGFYLTAEKSPNWKANKGYSAMHAWVKSRYPKPNHCLACKKPETFAKDGRSMLDLANISGMYKADVSDWTWLCRQCHVDLDQGYKKRVTRNGTNCFNGHNLDEVGRYKNSYSCVFCTLLKSKYRCEKRQAYREGVEYGKSLGIPRAELVEKIEKLDAGGGGSGRRLKVQILDLIKTINNE